jgi:uncharacterized protein (TIGR02996 family)
MADLSSYLVYGDWLSERGDPRGELIAVQAQLSASSENSEELEARAAQLLAENRRAWLDDLADNERELGFTWRLGFIDSVRFGSDLADYADAGSAVNFAEAYATLRALPSSPFVREIWIGMTRLKSSHDTIKCWQETIDAMATGAPTTLMRLVIDCGTWWDLTKTDLGSLGRLYPRLANLRELKLRAGSMNLGTIDLPLLRSFEVVTCGLTLRNMQSILAARWEHLERLSVCIGEWDPVHDGRRVMRLDDVALILEGTNLPRVRHLGLRNSSLANDIARALPSSRILAQLESLDLSSGTFGDVGARAILDNAAAFAHLKSIDLSYHYVSEPLQAELAALGPHIVLDDAQIEDEGGCRVADPGYDYAKRLLTFCSGVPDYLSG